MVVAVQHHDRLLPSLGLSAALPDPAGLALAGHNDGDTFPNLRVNLNGERMHDRREVGKAGQILLEFQLSR